MSAQPDSVRGAETGFRISVPGNLLLIGEYAVLEEGGLGIAQAVARRVSVRAVPEPESSFSRSGDVHSGDLPAAVTAVFREWARGHDLDPDEAAGRIEADSSALYNENGAKAGFGSSAAVAVGIAYALLTFVGYPAAGRIDGPWLRKTAAYRIALEGHRRFQGGRGSGYDIAVSTVGGPLLFCGGANPAYRKISLPWLPRLCLFRGPAPVATTGAVRRYDAWKRENPEKAARFLQDSNSAVTAFASSGSWQEAILPFSRCRDLSLQLGREIGVDADIEPPAEAVRAFRSGLWKAVGAGNELGVFFRPDTGIAALDTGALPGLEPLPLDEAGVMIERAEAGAVR